MMKEIKLKGALLQLFPKQISGPHLLMNRFSLGQLILHKTVPAINCPSLILF